ncbi:alpha/beta-hydrolase [Massarina eburnea CBS 473.64]|uniref:Alpha/beta-hydrolase n=1 Tax=Massarina eburnea CBS 473.64 TaxID=1395130 RepID=A0A6A6RIZ1_9PLEO|nr:alpha/beta-hydrolase [Massarina eburnea CBS 473.64]
MAADIPSLPTLSGAFVQTTNYLNVPGATLYYETYGTGPLILFISGGNGHADIWRPVAKVLASNYTVAIYDRRGFSRSLLSPTAIQDYSKRIETDATDAKLLLEKLAPNATKDATVFGTSSGAIIALQFLQMFPEVAKTVAIHEPPLVKILPDAAPLDAKQRELYDIYRAYGIPAAMLKFAEVYFFEISSTTSISLPDARENPHEPNNMQYWFEREFLQYPLRDMSLEEIGKQSKKLVLTNGKTTNPQAPQYRTNVVMGERFGLDVAGLAGGHMGYQGGGGAAWAEDLLEVLKGRE